MKQIEMPLTLIIVAVLAFFTVKDIQKQQAEAEYVILQAEKELKEKNEANAIAEKQKLIEEAKIRISIPHDGEKDTDKIKVTLDGRKSSDADKDSLTYLWKQTDGKKVKLSNTDEMISSFTAKSGEYTFSLTVTDTYGISNTSDVTVVINTEANTSPIANFIVY